MTYIIAYVKTQKNKIHNPLCQTYSPNLIDLIKLRHRWTETEWRPVDVNEFTSIDNRHHDISHWLLTMIMWHHCRRRYKINDFDLIATCQMAICNKQFIKIDTQSMHKEQAHLVWINAIWWAILIGILSCHNAHGVLYKISASWLSYQRLLGGISENSVPCYLPRAESKWDISMAACNDNSQ